MMFPFFYIKPDFKCTASVTSFTYIFRSCPARKLHMICMLMEVIFCAWRMGVWAKSSDYTRVLFWGWGCFVALLFAPRSTSVVIATGGSFTITPLSSMFLEHPAIVLGCVCLCVCLSVSPCMCLLVLDVTVFLVFIVHISTAVMSCGCFWMSC